jgi:hypothetical protein
MRVFNHALRIMRDKQLFKKDQDGNEVVESSQIRLYIQIMNQRNVIMDRIVEHKSILHAK